MEKTQELAAAKAGMDVKTARKYLVNSRPPSEQKAEREWRTRPDPFEQVWEELRQKIDANPGLEAKTLFEALQRESPGEFADGGAPSGPADAAAAHQTLAGHRGSGPRGVLRAETRARPVGPIRLHLHERVGHPDRGAEFSAHALPLRAHLLELGRRHVVLLGELGCPLGPLERGATERLMGTGRRAAETPDRSALDGGEQHERGEGVHQPLRGADAALPDGRSENPGRQSQRERRRRATSSPTETRRRPGAAAARQSRLPVGGGLPGVSATAAGATERGTA